uniref:PDZ domain-containing protein n=1 Tax=Musca domestica TaxID=7370 RepID=A0A1I8MUJ2_MUSDO
SLSPKNTAKALLTSCLKWQGQQQQQQQQVVELSGYVIILVENVDGKIKLYGSPPDRDNLEVGDEILEVNGLTLDNISRTEVIRHIHDCIKSCTICLRVRKKNDSRL